MLRKVFRGVGQRRSLVPAPHRCILPFASPILGTPQRPRCDPLPPPPPTALRSHAPLPSSAGKGPQVRGFLHRPEPLAANAPHLIKNPSLQPWTRCLLPGEMLTVKDLHVWEALGGGPILMPPQLAVKQGKVRPAKEIQTPANTEQTFLVWFPCATAKKRIEKRVWLLHQHLTIS